MRLKHWIVPLSLLLAAGCGPPPPVEEPQDLPPPEIPAPLPPPEVRCSVAESTRAGILADSVQLVPSEASAKLVLVGPHEVRVAWLDESFSVIEEPAPLAKAGRGSVVVAPASSDHVVLAELGAIKRGKGRVTVSRFGLGGERVGQSLRIDREKVARPDLQLACTAESCLLSWAETREGADAPVQIVRPVALADGGPELQGEGATDLPGVPSLLWRRGDAYEVVVADRRYSVSSSGEVDEGIPLETPRGAFLRLAESPTGAVASMFVESGMPYALTVAVLGAGSSEARTERVWPDASQETRFRIASGQLGFGAAWARPEGEVDPYSDAGGASRVSFQGFSPAGVPHGHPVELTDEPERVTSVDLAGLANGFIVAWTSAGEGSVGVARLTCRELTDAEVEAEARPSGAAAGEGPPSPPGTAPAAGSPAGGEPEPPQSD
jgi:hypothetical protein